MSLAFFKISTYWKWKDTDETFQSNYGEIIAEDDGTFCNSRTEITWDNIEEVLEKSSLFGVIKHKKKGRVFYADYPFGKIKEWKGDLGIILEKNVRKTECSLEKILEWHDSDIAMKYLMQKYENALDIMQSN